MSFQSVNLTAINEADIEWACKVLGLSPNAFSGAHGDDPRSTILKSLVPVDVEACPGSGKTTLLVAKLAILARSWTDRRRGICVLSHTNVARREIENRLGGTPEGKTLLRYPHYIGTIHGFVNEFLALPWLRSKPYPIRVIDDDICLQKRWYRLPSPTRFALTNGGHDTGVLKMAACDFSVGHVRWGKGGTLGQESETYQALMKACRESCEDGYFCHDEMFLWASEMLNHVRTAPQALRARFPLLFVDEVQDTQEKQAALLYRLFMEGEQRSIRQRFGDSNQAIYQYSSQIDNLVSDPFPDPSLKASIPNSYRFGQQIADFANPLGVVPQGLQGLGPAHQDSVPSDTQNKHAVFLFTDDTIDCVLPSFAAYLTETFSESELHKGNFTAVGATHRPGEDDKTPRFVAHYWSEYDHELTALEPKPATFLQYLAAGRALTQSSGKSHHLVDKFADATLRLVAIMKPTAALHPRKRRHRQLLQKLAELPEAEQTYIGTVATLIAHGGSDSFLADWPTVWGPKIQTVADALVGEAIHSHEATTFLFGQPASTDPQAVPTSRRDNIYRHPPQDTKVEIKVGSIHAVKGETHTATLVLDTFFVKHHLLMLKPWLLGAKSGGGFEKKTLLSRLRQHYVAMTRPSHLLCLAMREDCLTESDIDQLKTLGWRVARVQNAGSEWL
jgi:DNA helicase II / ATP-dependent DNA helicase PcrA